MAHFQDDRKHGSPLQQELSEMTWITDEIAIGNHIEAQDTELLRDRGIRSVISLDGTLGESQATELGLEEVVSFKLIDGAGNDLRIFEWAVEALERLVEEKPPVLVHCHAGRSRSAVVVAGYLTRARSLEPNEALAFVGSKREINVTPGLEELLWKLA